MEILNAIVSTIFDAYFTVMGTIGGEAALWVISAIAGVGLLLIFKATSNQKAIKTTKGRIAAGFLEVRLFKEDLGQMMRAQGGIFANAFRYMLYAMVPMLWMIIPVLLMLIQLNLWYGFEPLDEGGTAVVSARFDGDTPLVDIPMKLEAGSGFEVETPALRIESLREVNWRIRAMEPGVHKLRLTVGETTIEHDVHVTHQGGFRKIEPIRVRGVWPQLWSPGKAPLGDETPVNYFEVSYPEAEANLFGWKMHWVIVFFILSLVFGFAFKGVLGVEI